MAKKAAPQASSTQTQVVRSNTAPKINTAATSKTSTPTFTASVSKATGGRSSNSSRDAALINGGADILSGLGGIASPYISAEDKQNAIDALGSGLTDAQKAAMAAYGLGGVGVTQGLSGKEVKSNNRASALSTFAAEKLGLEGAAREKWVNQINKKISSGEVNLRNVGGGAFKDFVRENGDAFGLFVDETGRIRGTPVAPGMNLPTDPLKEIAGNLNEDILGGIQDLTGDYFTSARKGLDYTNQVRDMLIKNFDPEAGVGAAAAADMMNIQDIGRNNAQRVMGELLDSGFTSSNLAKRSLQKGVFDPEARLLTQMQSNLNNIRQQNTNTLIGSLSALGAPNYNAMKGALISPEYFGGITDPQAVNSIQRRQEFGANMIQDTSRNIANAQLTPTMPVGGGMDLGGGLAGVGGGALAGSAFGPIGAGIGGVIGGLGGLFS